jgi:hypothetical protein
MWMFCCIVGLYKDVRNFFIISSAVGETLIYVRMTGGFEVVFVNKSGY